MDRTIDPSKIRQRHFKTGGRVTVALAGLGLAFIVLRSLITPSVSLANVRTAVVETGEVSSTIVASGVVTPKFEEVVASPIGARIQTVFANLGATVEKGEPLLQLDSGQVELDIAKLKDQLELKAVEERAAVQKNKADIAELESRRELLEIDLESQQLRLAHYRALYEKSAVSKFDLDDRAIQLKKTHIELRQIDQRLQDLQASAANQAERLALEKSILRQQLAEQQRLLDRSLVKALSAGVLTSLLDEPGKSVPVGTELARIADLSRYHVEANVSDFYRSQLAEGLPVNLNANGQVVRGKVSKILPTVAAEGVLLLNVDFKPPAEVSLQPNMRLELEILTRQETEGLRVRNGAAFKGSGKQEVFILEDDTLQKRTVQTGLVNTQFVQITEGLAAGDTVVISNMDNYLHLDEIALR